MIDWRRKAQLFWDYSQTVRIVLLTRIPCLFAMLATPSVDSMTAPLKQCMSQIWKIPLHVMSFILVLACVTHNRCHDCAAFALVCRLAKPNLVRQPRVCRLAKPSLVRQPRRALSC